MKHVVRLLVALVVLAGAGVRDGRAQGARVDVLVMPFENTGGEPRLYWLGEGSAVLLSELFEQADEAVVPRDERERAFERLQLPAAPALSHATVIKLGQLVGATEIVVGAYALEGDQLVVRARRIELESGRLGPEVEERGPLAMLTGTYARVAGALGGRPAVDVSADPLLASPKAVEAYVKGLVAETPTTRAGFLEEAVTLSKGDARVRLAQWELYHQQGEDAKALDVVGEVPDAGRWARAARFDAAVSLMQMKRYDEAFDRLEALEAAEASAAVLNAMGVVQLRRGGTPQAGMPTYFFTKATETDGTDGDYFFNLGYAYWRQRDPQAAIYWLREAVRRDPTDGEAHWMLGAILEQTGAKAEAARERELGQRLAPDTVEWETAPDGAGAPPGLARLKTRLERAGQRVDAALAASGQRDQDQMALFHLEAGRRAFEREADREAEGELRKALYLSPYLADAHLLLGRIYLRGGRAADAVDALKIALWSAETAEAHAALAEAYVQLQDPDLAREEARRALALDPGSETAKAVLDKVGPGEWRQKGRSQKSEVRKSESQEGLRTPGFVSAFAFFSDF